MPPSHEDVLTIAHGPLILVVDDQPAPRSEVCRMIRGFGYPVRSAGSGREALELMAERSREVRLLIADLGDAPDGRRGAGGAGPGPGSQPPGAAAGRAGRPRVTELESGYRDLPSLRKPITFGDLVPQDPGPDRAAVRPGRRAAGPASIPDQALGPPPGLRRRPLRLAPGASQIGVPLPGPSCSGRWCARSSRPWLPLCFALSAVSWGRPAVCASHTAAAEHHGRSHDRSQDAREPAGQPDVRRPPLLRAPGAPEPGGAGRRPAR